MFIKDSEDLVRFTPLSKGFKGVFRKEFLKGSLLISVTTSYPEKLQGMLIDSQRAMLLLNST